MKRFCFAAAFFLTVTLFLCFGCGKKENPEPELAARKFLTAFYSVDASMRDSLVDTNLSSFAKLSDRFNGLCTSEVKSVLTSNSAFLYQVKVCKTKSATLTPATITLSPKKSDENSGTKKIEQFSVTFRLSASGSADRTDTESGEITAGKVDGKWVVSNFYLSGRSRLFQAKAD